MMKRFSIKYQILLITMIPVFLIDTFLTIFYIDSSINQAERLLQSKGEIIAQQLAGATEFSLFSGDYEQIQYLLNQSINTHNIIFAAVYDMKGKPVAKAEGEGYSRQSASNYFYYRQSIQTQTLGSSDIFSPEVSDDTEPLRNIGSVHLYVSRRQLTENIKQIFSEGLIFFFAMLILAALLTIIISRRITRPIFLLLDYLNKIEKGKLGEVIENLENNEIGDVQKGFNSMSQSLLANRMQLDQKIKTATVELINAISDLEYKNRELGIARDQAQNADRVKSQFLANMSHEIRTPIHGIQGFVNLLSRTELKPDQKRYTDIINQSTHDLSAIINEVLDFSKIESGNIELHETEFSLFELLESTRDSLFTTAMEKGIDLYLTLYSDTPNFLLGDPVRLKQILINLIGNAIKFTDQGYVNITVFMQDEYINQCSIRINIEDSGIGISEQDQPTLFKAFKQIESDSNRRYSGTGLGLVISKNMAKLMGGDITLQSSPGSGSLFSLTLPFVPVKEKSLTSNPFTGQAVMIYCFTPYSQSELQSLFNRIGFDSETQLIDGDSDLDTIKSQLSQNLNYFSLIVMDLRHKTLAPDDLFDTHIKDKKNIIVMHYDQTLVDSNTLATYPFLSIINTGSNLRQILSAQKEPATGMPPQPNSNRSSRPKKILLVDDNPINLKLAVELTQLWGHHPYEASHARQAMQLFKRMSFDLILLDIQMPEIDGVDLMKMMREYKPDLDTPIVAITANVMDMEKERLLKAGFNAYISKPIEEEKLRLLLEHQPVIENTDSTPDFASASELSIDYDLTMRLTAKNSKLANEIFTLLQSDLPDYRSALQNAVESKSIEDIAAIVHKLQGVTCYAGLPRLKQLLSNCLVTDELKDEFHFQTCTEIIRELGNIEHQLEQFFASRHSA